MGVIQLLLKGFAYEAESLRELTHDLHYTNSQQKNVLIIEFWSILIFL